MLHYPKINPIAFHIGPLEVHWYGIMYLLGFVGAWVLGSRRAISRQYIWQGTPKQVREQVADFVFYCAIGLIIGGRLGSMLFYNFSAFTADPLLLFKVWQGGMSFHGGMLGSIVACWIYGKQRNLPFFDLTDFAVPVVPIGLGLGRIGNFINGELWGRVTQLPWGMVFPDANDGLPRHPSQLYEFFLEGVLLFTILWVYSRKPRPRAHTTGVFFLCYGTFRFMVEFVRQPDANLGFIAFGWLTMGQLLSLPMIFFGLWLLLGNKRPIQEFSV